VENLLPSRLPVGDEEVDALATHLGGPYGGRHPLSDEEHLGAVLRVELVE
jgi:hypothetical protein